jgi:hypothetical protein
VIFNRVVDGKIDIGVFQNLAVFATHIQIDELGNTPTLKRRTQLLSTFRAIDPAMCPTPSAVWDVSVWDQACWSPDDGVLQSLRKRIVELDKKDRASANQIRDALIAETAIKNNLMLVTDDNSLAKNILEHGGQVMTMAQLLG